MLVATSWTHRVRVVGAIVVASTIALALGSCTPIRKVQRAEYCAIMPDSVGLYVGNPVTQMGYKVGEITAIIPANSDVRVDFAMIENRRLPAEVRAATRSTSILTDRELELVGNYTSGPQLRRESCIPLSRSSTPKSLSEIIGSTTHFLNAINPNGSSNIGDVVTGLDQRLHNNGAGINHLLTTASAVLDAPDQAIGDVRSIIINLAQLTTTLSEIRGPLKEVMLEAQRTNADVADAVKGGKDIFVGVGGLNTMFGDLDAELGDETQTLLNDAEYALRKVSAHSALFASLLKPFPVLTNWIGNHFNNHRFFTIRYRPPLYRIATPVDGLITCGAMNTSSPGSCTDVAGKPYAVDVALLQYVLTQAARR